MHEHELRRPEVVKTLIRGDGKRRVLILRRPDGWYSFREEAGYDREHGKYWAELPSHASICDRADSAEREARATIPWLVAGEE